MKMETLRVTKEDIDNVISTYFSKVFAQNQIRVDLVPEVVRASLDLTGKILILIMED